MSRFGEWTRYEHKVKAMLGDGQLVTMPQIERPRGSLARTISSIPCFVLILKKCGIWRSRILISLSSIGCRSAMTTTNFIFQKTNFRLCRSTAIHQSLKNFDHANIEILLNTQFLKSMEADYVHVSIACQLMNTTLRSAVRLQIAEVQECNP